MAIKIGNRRFEVIGAKRSDVTVVFFCQSIRTNCPSSRVVIRLAIYFDSTLRKLSVRPKYGQNGTVSIGQEKSGCCDEGVVFKNVVSVVSAVSSKYWKLLSLKRALFSKFSVVVPWFPRVRNEPSPS